MARKLGKEPDMLHVTWAELAVILIAAAMHFATVIWWLSSRPN
jgi:hypothetical protein